MRTPIEMIPRDISTGKPMDDKSCPVAKAINRAFKGKVKASVGTAVFSLDKGHETVSSGTLPQKAKEFIMDFDGGLKPKPIKFTLVHKAFK